jgi:hypothetical protein
MFILCSEMYLIVILNPKKTIKASAEERVLYLKFKLSNEKTSFVPRDNVIFTVFHSNS